MPHLWKWPRRFHTVDCPLSFGGFIWSDCQTQEARRGGTELYNCIHHHVFFATKGDCMEEVEAWQSNVYANVAIVQRAIVMGGGGSKKESPRCFPKFLGNGCPMGAP